MATFELILMFCLAEHFPNDFSMQFSNRCSLVERGERDCTTRTTLSDCFRVFFISLWSENVLTCFKHAENHRKANFRHSFKSFLVLGILKVRYSVGSMYRYSFSQTSSLIFMVSKLYRFVPETFNTPKRKLKSE
jgi:hypothetical protein